MFACLPPRRSLHGRRVRSVPYRGLMRVAAAHGIRRSGARRARGRVAAKGQRHEQAVQRRELSFFAADRDSGSIIWPASRHHTRTSEADFILSLVLLRVCAFVISVVRDRK